MMSALDVLADLKRMAIFCVKELRGSQRGSRFKL